MDSIDATTDKSTQGDHNAAIDEQTDTRVIRPANSKLCATSHNWLTKTDRWFLFVMLLLGFSLGIANWIRHSGWGLQPVEIVCLSHESYQYQVDLNNANWLELVLLDGIGETLAKRIVEYRDQNGPFHRVDELLEIKGIGQKTLEKLRSQVICQPPSIHELQNP